MARPVRIEVVGDAASYTGALGAAAAATARFSEKYEAEFASMQTSTLALAVAQDKLAIATSRFGASTTGAARATLAYRREVEALQERQLAAAMSVARSMSRYVTAPTLLAAAAAVKMGIDFQRNMQLIYTQAGASAGEVRKLNGQVLDLARNSALGPTELAKGLYHVESLGLRGGEAMKVLKTSSDAAFLGIADLETVTTALGGAVVSGIRGSQNYEKAMGTLDATIGAGNMRMEDLAQALGGVLAPAKNAGISLAEVGAAMAVLTDRGMGADEAGTRLRMTFALMQAPSKQAQKALDDLGISGDQMAKMLRAPNGLYNVLRLLHDQMETVGKVRGSQDLLRAFGGGRTGAGILTLVQSLDSAVSSYQGKLTQIESQSGAFHQKVVASQQSDAYKIARAWSSVQADLVKLGGTLAPGATAVAEAVGKIADAFDALPGPVKHELGIIIGLLAVGGPLALAVLGSKKMIGALADAFPILRAKAGPAIATTDAEIATIATTAEATAVKTEASLAGIGASATAAKGEVAGLSGGLKALGALTVAPIVIDVVERIIQTKAGKKLGLDYSGLDLLHDAGKLLGIGGGSSPKRKHGPYLGDPWMYDPNWKPGSAYAVGSGNPNPHDLPVGVPMAIPPPSAVPLTPAQQLQVGLTLHPDDLNLLRQLAARDRNVLAFAAKQRDRGRITNDKYLAIVQKYGTELAATEAHINSIVSAATRERDKQAKKTGAARKQPLLSGSFDFAFIPNRVHGSVQALAAQYATAPGIQLELAHAQATGDQGAIHRALEHALKAAHRAIQSGRLSIEAQTDAWNTIADINGQLASTTTGTPGGYAHASMRAITAGLDLSKMERKTLQIRVAQALAHGGRVPTGPAALGIPLGSSMTQHVTINVHDSGNPRATARAVLNELQKHGKRNAAQRTGVHGGHQLALS